MNINGVIWWVIHAECPIAQRFQRERRLAILNAITAALEQNLSDEELKRWLTQDKLSAGIEAFAYDDRKVVTLRRFKSRFTVP